MPSARLALACLALAASAAALVQPRMPASRPVMRSAVLPRLATTPLMRADAAAAKPQPAAIKMQAAESEDSLMETLKTGSFFALWYLFNIGYNIYNKKALNALPIPYTMAFLQLAVGIPYVMALWVTGLRKAPKLSMDNIKTLIPVSLGHLGTHIGAVVSLGAGAVSFTHIVKASEPVVSAALSAVLLGS